MARVTFEMGPTWKMELLHDVLAEHGVPSFVVDANLKQIDPFVTGALALETRLEVPEKMVEAAHLALETARAEGRAFLPQDEEEERAQDEALVKIADLGRRIRWATVLVWMHPFVLFYGWKYMRALSLTWKRPPGHALTMLALAGVTTLWSGILVLELRGLLA